jgi:hypothetical protein
VDPFASGLLNHVHAGPFIDDDLLRFGVCEATRLAFELGDLRSLVDDGRVVHDQLGRFHTFVEMMHAHEDE